MLYCSKAIANCCGCPWWTNCKAIWPISVNIVIAQLANSFFFAWQYRPISYVLCCNLREKQSALCARKRQDGEINKHLIFGCQINHYTKENRSLNGWQAYFIGILYFNCFAPQRSSRYILKPFFMGWK